MQYRTEKQIIDDKGTVFRVGDKVSVFGNDNYPIVAACGVTITKITDTGFRYIDGWGHREKSVQYKNIEEIRESR